ncbi:MAG: Gfo/Idh/MocA family oxidoreductase [Fibrobacteres bacterium]|nr:Gfo/Idh/MocA family oxidoreductase [Fibrobacterota bacterium]
MNSLNKKYSSNAKTYTDENSFFSHPGMDWVMICSPNNTHRRHIELSVKNNLKIFCEKPLATSIDDLSAIMNTINSSNTPCMIGFTLRYSPFYRKIKSLLQSGIIGKPVSFEFNETIGFNHGGHIMRDWRRNSADSGGHLLEKCCHDIDLANWMTDSIPVRVASFGGRNFFLPENAVRMDELAPDTNGLKAYCSYDHVGDSLDNPFTGEGDIIDNQVCIFEYKNGIRATFHTNLNAGILERRMYILGTHGALRGDVLTGQIETKKIGFDTPYERHDMTAASGGHGGGDKVLAPYLVKMMTENVESLTPAIDGAVSAAVAIITDEARKDGSVKSLDGIWKKWGV